MGKKVLRVKPENIDYFVSKNTINNVASFIGQYRKSVINLGYDQKTIKAINKTQRYFLNVDVDNVNSQKTLKRKINDLQFLSGVERVYNVDEDTVEFEFKYATKKAKKKLERFKKINDYSKEAISQYYQYDKGDSPLTLQHLLEKLDYEEFAEKSSSKKIEKLQRKIVIERNKLLERALQKGKKKED